MLDFPRWFTAAAAIAGACLGSASAQAVPVTTAPTTTAPATTAPATQPAQVVPEAALQAIDAKRYKEALAILEPMAQLSSASFDVLAKTGGCCEQLANDLANGRKPDERENFKKYADKAVEYFLRGSQLGLNSGDQAMRARAETLLRHALVFKPREPSALRTLGQLYEQNNSATMAIAQYREYIKTDAGQADYETQVGLGRLLVAQGYWRQAVDLLEKIRTQAGPAADQQLALAYLAGRQPEKALDAADRAVGDDPQRNASDAFIVDPQRATPDALILRASLLLQLGEQSDSRQPVEKRHRPMENALAAVQLVRYFLAADSAGDQNWPKLGGWRQGIANVTEALKGGARNGKLDPPAELQLAGLINGLGDLTRMYYDYDAVSILNYTTRAENAPVELLIALAQRQRDLGLATAAVKTAERILQRDPTNAIAQKLQATAGKPETK